MGLKLKFSIQPQPHDDACGPTCLHAVYHYFGRALPLEEVIRDVPRLPSGGTLAVLLACHALRQGYRARIYPFNLNLFDPTWFDLAPAQLTAKLKAQRRHKSGARLRISTEAFVQFLELGGELRFEDLTPALIRKYLSRSLPIITGLSSTYLYRSPREAGPNCDPDDIRGQPAGHFVVLSGYDREERCVQISDPLLPNPFSPSHHYEVSLDRVICAILLGVITYDANLLIIQPR